MNVTLRLQPEEQGRRAHMTEEFVFHPQLDENGQPVIVSSPTPAGPAGNWLDSALAATLSITEPGDLPASLNGIPFSHVKFTDRDWVRFLRRYEDWPDQPEPRTSKRLTSGLVIAEPDGRFWLVHPTNRFGGVEATFPKGRLEPGLSLVVNAIKEGWEESGILAEPLGWLCDVDRTKTVTRYYMARRVAGSPVDAGWESQAVSLVPASTLLEYLNRPNDRKILPAIAAWRARAQRRASALRADAICAPALL